MNSDQALKILTDLYPNQRITEMEGNPNIFGCYAFWVGKRAALVDDGGVFITSDEQESTSNLKTK